MHPRAHAPPRETTVNSPPLLQLEEAHTHYEDPAQPKKETNNEVYLKNQ